MSMPPGTLSLKISDEFKVRVRKVQNRIGATSVTEVVRRAIVVYDVLTETTHNKTNGSCWSSSTPSDD